MKKIGNISDEVITKLALTNIADRNIYIGASNIEHMKNEHPDDFKKYGSEISDILSHPDYIRKHKKNGSIEYVKEYKLENDYVKIAVRVSSGNRFYARSLYVLNRRRVQDFIKKGTLIPYGTD